jgi:ferrous iron transport protein A
MTSNSDNTRNSQFWNVTFIGGTADFKGEDITPSTRPTTPPPSGGQLPLAMTGVGDRVQVVRIKGGHRMVRRLTDLGIVQGCEITIVSRMASGSVIVALQGCRLGLGAGMAHRVMVTPAQ